MINKFDHITRCTKAKAALPVYWPKELTTAVESAGKRFHRSTAEQIEYCAEMGRSVSTLLAPDDLAAIAAGEAKLESFPVCGKPVSSGYGLSNARG